MGWVIEVVYGFGCTYRVERFRVLGFTVYTRWVKT